MKFTGRIARRNNLHLFAWLCALAVPAGLQLLAGLNEDVASYMGEYYGPISLFMFFTMTYGFATVFVSYYLVGSIKRAGTLDMLRVSQARPRDVVLGVFWQLARVLVPPVLVFMSGFAVYAFWLEEGRQLFSFGWLAVTGAALMMVINQLVLSALMCMALYRSEHAWALLSAILVLPLNAAPVVVIYMLRIPVPLYIAVMVALTVLILLVAGWHLGRAWPPTPGQLKGT